MGSRGRPLPEQLSHRQQRRVSGFAELHRRIYRQSVSGSNAGWVRRADFVLDRVQSAGVTLGSVNVGQRQWRTAGFAQDNYKVRPNLTLIFGLRYEFDEPWVEAERQDRNTSISRQARSSMPAASPVGAPAGSGLCSNRACYQPNYRQIMPHVGFAYQPTDRLVVRGGYGATSFFEGNSFNQRLTSITPFIQAVNVPVTSPTQGDRAPRRAPPKRALPAAPLSTAGTFNVYPQNIQPAYVQEWNLTLQYAMSRTGVAAGRLHRRNGPAH